MGNLACCIDEDLSASETEKLINKEKANIKWNKQKKIKLAKGSSFGQPLINGNNILFVGSYRNCVIIKSYNITNKTYAASQEIKVDDQEFDIQQCEYTFDSANNLIYFINDNKQIMTVNVNTNKLTTNQNITTDNNKYTQIEKVKNKTYILGTSNSEYEQKSANENFTFIPYDAYKTKEAMNKTVSMEQNKCGYASITVNVTINKNDYIFIMGGEKDYNASCCGPDDTIWVLNLSLMNESGRIVTGGIITEQKWTKRFLPHCMNSFGIVNYKNKYLMTFGGWRLKNKKLCKTNTIYILDLDSEDKEWHSLSEQLPLKGGCFALYDNNNKSDIVHLFAWNGKYFTMNMKDITNAFDNKQCIPERPWTEQGKTVLPTKSKSIKNMGPKIDEDDDDDE